MIPGGWLGLLVAGIILGALGQGARSIIGLKKLNDYKDSSSAVFDGARLLISLGIGGVAGAFAAIAILPDSGPISKEQLLGIAAAGYAGTDFIEGFISRISGSVSPALTKSAPAAAKGARNNAFGLLDGGGATTASASAVTATSVAALIPPFSQQVVDICGDINLRNSADVVAMFAGQGGFFAWYNSVLSATAAFRHRGRAQNTAAINQHFTQFWDQIPNTFGRPQISAIEFCALMSVSIQETTGDLTAAPEEMNGPNRPHPGLAYAFDKIAGLKQSYNTTPNKTAYQLFTDPLFLKQHGGLPGSAVILNNPGGVDRAWSGQTWPASYPTTTVNPAVNGFVMAADFYKFRGRGVIQTTWRSDYKLLIGYILSGAAAGNSVLAALAQKWTGVVPGLAGDEQIEAIATISTEADWTSAFGEPLTLAAGVSIDNNAKGGYLSLSHDAGVLLADKRTKGSCLYMAAKINGGSYPTTVAPMMQTMMCAIAGLSQPAIAAIGRLPRWPDV